MKELEECTNHIPNNSSNLINNTTHSHLTRHDTRDADHSMSRRLPVASTETKKNAKLHKLVSDTKLAVIAEKYDDETYNNKTFLKSIYTDKSDDISYTDYYLEYNSVTRALYDALKTGKGLIVIDNCQSSSHPLNGTELRSLQKDIQSCDKTVIISTDDKRLIAQAGLLDDPFLEEESDRLDGKMISFKEMITNKDKDKGLESFEDYKKRKKQREKIELSYLEEKSLRIPLVLENLKEYLSKNSTVTTQIREPFMCMIDELSIARKSNSEELKLLDDLTQQFSKVWDDNMKSLCLPAALNPLIIYYSLKKTPHNHKDLLAKPKILFSVKWVGDKFSIKNCGPHEAILRMTRREEVSSIFEIRCKNEQDMKFFGSMYEKLFSLNFPRTLGLVGQKRYGNLFSRRYRQVYTVGEEGHIGIKKDVTLNWVEKYRKYHFHSHALSSSAPSSRVLFQHDGINEITGIIDCDHDKIDDPDLLGIESYKDNVKNRVFFLNYILDPFVISSLYNKLNDDQKILLGSLETPIKDLIREIRLFKENDIDVGKINDCIIDYFKELKQGFYNNLSVSIGEIIKSQYKNIYQYIIKERKKEGFDDDIKKITRELSECAEKKGFDGTIPDFNEIINISIDIFPKTNCKEVYQKVFNLILNDNFIKRLVATTCENIKFC